MKESREEIRNYLKMYHANEIKLLYEVIARGILANHDFRIAVVSDKDEICEVIEKESERKINFSCETIINKDDAALFREIDELDYKQTKLKKAKRVELMAGVLGSDTLFEGFCLAFHESDDRLEEFCKLCGCPGRYHECALGPVYRKRKKYSRLIADYAAAAANLYGVIHIAELEGLIWEYEKIFRNCEGYTKESGSYQNTIVFTPEFLCTYTLHNLVGNVVLTVCTTLDGFVLHLCFWEDYQREQQEFAQYYKGVNRELTEDDLSSFYGSRDTSFRCLHDLAYEKEIYLPAKKEFLRYVDEAYCEENLAQKQMKRYIEQNFMSEFSKAAKERGISTLQCIDDFMHEICEQASDRKDLGGERDVNEFVQFLFESLQAYDVYLDSTERANELLGYAMDVANSVRLWINHGCTPQEVRRQIPVFGFQHGMDGGMKKGLKKIYPNDPCPCGSGKKYKKCCGR